ncbi:MAG: porin family protein [Acidobacteriota bacterium]
MYKATRSLAALFVLACFTLPQPVAAGQSHFEIFAGQYFADSSIGDEPVVGLRGGYRFNDRFGLEASLSRAEVIDPIASVFGADGDGVFFDVSARWYLTPEKRAQWVLYGGPGYASLESGRQFRFDFLGPRDPDDPVLSTDSVSLHVGIGVEIAVGRRTYLRPDVKARWLEGYSSNDGFLRSDFEYEATVGFGWKFGKP